MAKAGALLRLGLMEGDGKGREVALRPNVYLHAKGGHFVKMSYADGSKSGATLCASGDKTVLGWLVSPKQDAGKAGYVTVSGDKGYVMQGYNDVFALRPDESKASMAASWISHGIAVVNTGATYGLLQKGKYAAGITASPLTCVDVDVNNKILFVKVMKHQAN